MKSNNGKLAIGIVAMFVVALSVVGFTYAYFVASVRGNTAEKSVEVTAGRLEIVYANGNEIVAQNIVPGWVSDGAHFYDVQYSSSDANGDGQYDIVAVKTADHATKSDTSAPTAADGLTSPVTFNVSNSEKNTADNKYIVKLTGVENGIAAVDQANMFVTLYSGTFGDATPDTIIWSGNLVAGTAETKGTQIIVPEPITLPAGATVQNYYVMLTYKNIDGVQISQGVGVKATVEIMGIAINNEGSIVDADGTVLKTTDSTTNVFPAANVTAPTDGLQ